MIRNPWRVDHEYWSGPWNDKDTKRWTADYKKQVPYKDENDGVFFVEDKDFVKAFKEFTISFYSNGKHSSHYEVLNDDGNTKVFNFEVPSDQKGYVGMSFYNKRMYPENCKKDKASGKFILIDPKGKAYSMQAFDLISFNFIHVKNLIKGKYTVVVDNTWTP